MFVYQEFLAKARLFFSRAAEAEESTDERGLWLLLGLEPLLRAPLANVNPTLLAALEGDSILHAAGVKRARGAAKSVQAKTVIDRLTKIDPEFGEDRGKDAAFLTDLRNEELHSSSATLANTDESAWLPKWLDVVEAICAHLGIEVDTIADTELLEAAETVRATSDAAVQGQVRQRSLAAKQLFDGLRETEITARLDLPSPFAPDGERFDCPVCAKAGGWLLLSKGRTTESRYNEEDQQIEYDLVQVPVGFACTICGLTLNTTAEVLAAGVPRLHVTTISEDRYEGWEELMTYQDAITYLGADEYGND